MTLLIAAKIPSRHLNPYRRPIEFAEKGILMVADTRLSYVRRTQVLNTVDDSLKLFNIGNCALAGFCGTYRVAEPAIIASQLNLKWKHKPWKIVVRMVEHLLQFYQKDAIKTMSRLEPTVLLLGVKTKEHSFRLYEMDSQTGFKRSERDGVIVAGTGQREFKERFPKEMNERSMQWARQLSGYKLVKIDGKPCCVPSDPDEKYIASMCGVSSVFSSIADDIVTSEIVPSVGGCVQVVTITDGGVKWIGAHTRSVRGEWRQVTPNNLRTYSEIDKVAYCIPLVDDKGNVTDQELDWHDLICKR